MSIATTPPRFAIRCTTYCGWMLPLFVWFTYQAFRERLPLNLFTLILFSAIGAALTIPGAIQVLKLRKKKESRLMTAVSALTAGVGIIVLLTLKSRGIFVWNELYGTVPLLLCMAIIYSACFFSEDKNHIKVYFAADGFHYVRA